MEPHSVLPRPGERNVLITCALPYVNNVPHLGNIIGSVLSADVFARYCRSRGVSTLFIGGTDEYGTPTEIKALKEDCTPKEMRDKFHAVHAQVYQWFNISFDVFGRTTTQRHTEIAQDIFRKLNAGRLLDERVTPHLYCDNHGAFLADRLVEGGCRFCGDAHARGDQCASCSRLLDPLELIHPRCKVDGATPSTRLTKHIYLRLDELQPEIETLVKNVSVLGGWPSNARASTGTWLRDGLKPCNITRDIRWGTPVPLPGYEDKAIYPWFDACIGYASITAGYTDHWEQWWRNPDVRLYQFLGKDNVVFHSVIFPATQIGTGDTWTKVHHLAATEYLNYEGGKFSKSRGVGVFGDSVQRTGVPADVWRFYLLMCRPESADTEFTWEGLVSAINSLLLEKVGNFVTPVLQFVARAYDHAVPSFGEDVELTQEVNRLLRQYIRQLNAVELRAGLATVLAVGHCGNAFMQSNKFDTSLLMNNPDDCAAVVGLAVNLVHLLAALLEPYMPETATAINSQLRADPLAIREAWDAQSIKAGHRIGQPAQLFGRIDSGKAAEWREAFGQRR